MLPLFVVAFIIGIQKEISEHWDQNKLSSLRMVHCDHSNKISYSKHICIYKLICAKKFLKATLSLYFFKTISRLNFGKLI